MKLFFVCLLASLCLSDASSYFKKKVSLKCDSDDAADAIAEANKVGCDAFEAQCADSLHAHCIECCQITVIAFGDSLTDSGEDSYFGGFQELLEDSWNITDREIDWENEYSVNSELGGTKGYFKGSFTNSPGSWPAQIKSIAYCKDYNVAHSSAEVRDNSQFFSIPTELADTFNASINTVPTATCLDPAKENCQFNFIDPPALEDATTIPGPVAQVQKFLDSGVWDTVKNKKRAVAVIHAFGGNDFSVGFRRGDINLFDPATNLNFIADMVTNIAAAVNLLKQSTNISVVVTGIHAFTESPGFVFAVQSDPITYPYPGAFIGAVNLIIEGINTGYSSLADHYVDTLGFLRNITGSFENFANPCVLDGFTFYRDILVCPEPEKHLYFDGIHFSSAAQLLIAQRIREEVENAGLTPAWIDFPEEDFVYVDEDLTPLLFAFFGSLIAVMSCCLCFIVFKRCCSKSQTSDDEEQQQVIVDSSTLTGINYADA